MVYSEHQLAVISAQKYNILPITSACNLSCIFCSHQGNADQVETFASGHRSLEEIKELISFLQAGQKVTIGESLTRIEEGEPFLHPQFEKIIELIRANLPETSLKLTTNGTELTKSKIDLLAKVKPVELNVSLNTVGSRKELMQDYSGGDLLTKFDYLQQQEVIYHGSIVALPQFVGWEDIDQTIAYLDQYGARTIRVFLPGYTRFSPEEIKFELSLWEELEEFIHHKQQQYFTPITLEPARIKRLTPRLEGVIPDFPAAEAGLQPHDELVTINGESVFSRVDAFNRLLKSGNPEVKINREGSKQTVTLSKEPGDKSGVVVNYDVDPGLLLRINRVVNSNQAQRILMLTSCLAEQRLQQAFSLLPSEWDWEVAAVENEFFGGSIMSAGLLTVNDFRAVLKNYSGDLNEFDLILLPAAPFNFSGLDLVGEHYRQLEDEFNIDLEVVD